MRSQTVVESPRERYLAAVVAVQKMLLERKAGDHFLNLLSILGQAAGADRVYYYRGFYAPEGDFHAGLMSEWTRPGVAPDTDLADLADIPVGRMMPDVYATFLRGDPVAAVTANTHGVFRELLETTGVKSVLLLPVIIDGAVAGVFGYDNCAEARPWKDDEIDLLRAACGAVAVAIERERAEARLLTAQSKLDRHIQQSPLGIIEWDEEFRVAFWSKQAEVIFGWKSSEIVGRGWPDWKFVHEDDAAEVARISDRLMKGTTPYSISFNRNYARDGTVRNCEWYNSVLRDAAGRVRSTLSLVLDVTERVRARQELQRAQAQAAQTEKMAALGQMASGIAHDFNNALTVILGKAELLLTKKELPEKVANTLREILTAGTDAAATVRRMQQFVRNRPSAAHVEPVDLTSLAREVIELTRHRWSDQALARGASITLTTDLSGPACVAADPSELRELAMNLIFNAVDALPRGGILVVETGAEAGRAYLRVGDTGDGMDPDTVRRCFEPFFTTKGIDGTGLGLTVSWSIAQRLGGELAVDSRPGAGSTFTLWLPEAVGPIAAKPTVPKASTKALRVLLIDDREDVARTMANLLSQLGHMPTSANGGAEGLTQLQRHPFDVVITDLAMPGMDGRAVAERAQLIRPGTPVLLLTGWADELNANGELPAGVSRVLAKPLSIDKLQETLSAVTQPGN
ncbi:MAG: PAS domain S-box protein [Gemmataceae bacterium]|nr:PAS domain S-box protein [Gemmataceae bacterium]